MMKLEWKNQNLTITLDSGSWATYRPGKHSPKPFRFQTGLVTADSFQYAEVLCVMDDVAQIAYEERELK